MCDGRNGALGVQRVFRLDQQRQEGLKWIVPGRGRGVVSAALGTRHHGRGGGTMVVGVRLRPARGRKGALSGEVTTGGIACSAAMVGERVASDARPYVTGKGAGVREAAGDTMSVSLVAGRVTLGVAGAVETIAAGSFGGRGRRSDVGVLGTSRGRRPETGERSQAVQSVVRSCRHHRGERDDDPPGRRCRRTGRGWRGTSIGNCGQPRGRTSWPT